MQNCWRSVCSLLTTQISLVILVSKGLCMHEIQNDLLFRYCFIYLLNGLIDVLGSYIKQKTPLFFFFSFRLQPGVSSHSKDSPSRPAPVCKEFLLSLACYLSLVFIGTKCYTLDTMESDRMKRANIRSTPWSSKLYPICSRQFFLRGARSEKDLSISKTRSQKSTASLLYRGRRTEGDSPCWLPPVGLISFGSFADTRLLSFYKDILLSN